MIIEDEQMHITSTSPQGESTTTFYVINASFIRIFSVRYENEYIFHAKKKGLNISNIIRKICFLFLKKTWN